MFDRIQEIIESDFANTPLVGKIKALTTLEELGLKNPDLLIEFAFAIADEFEVFFSDKQVFDWNTVHDVVQSTQDSLLATSVP